MFILLNSYEMEALKFTQIMLRGVELLRHVDAQLDSNWLRCSGHAPHFLFQEITEENRYTEEKIGNNKE